MRPLLPVPDPGGPRTREEMTTPAARGISALAAGVAARLARPARGTHEKRGTLQTSPDGTPRP